MQASREGHLEALAHELASEQPGISIRSGREPTLIEHLDIHERQLEDAYEHFASASVNEVSISYAGEWLLDNNYILHQAIRFIREDMPEGFYTQLPKLDGGPLEGYPRVYRLAVALVKNYYSPLDYESIYRFVAAYQEVIPLTIGELWALPVMLRLAVLEDLANAFLRILKPTQGVGPGVLPPTAELQEADDGVIVGNGILNLRSLATQDWKQIFEDLSIVEKTLQKDPAGIYAFMDFETRDQYRRAIEEIALASDLDEGEVALRTIDVAKMGSEETDSEHGISGDGDSAEFSYAYKSFESLSPDPKVPRKAHVGYYLIGDARQLLEAQLGYQPTRRVRLKSKLSSYPTFNYLGGISLLTLVLILAVLVLALPPDTNLIGYIAVSILLLIPMMTAAVNLVNWIVTRTVKVQSLPKLNFQNGIPDAYRSMIVIPGMLSSNEEVDSLLEQLELHHLSNPDPNLRFALLTDFMDAAEETMPEDDGLLQRARDGIKHLNDHYAIQEENKFSLFHRKRVWNPCENLWMGWERKRGKLAEFNNLLRGTDETTYIETYSVPEDLHEIRYVVTLDGDTLIPEGSARRLIGTLAHPLNHAQFQPGSGMVNSGYTILQPRVEIQPTSANKTTFSRIFSGDAALDLYSRAVSDVYQDIFGEGIYVGKGIYEVDSFERSLRRRIPEDALLSHDLFEGIHGRAGLVTDVTLLEDFPPQYLAYAQRLHRWFRGDWQLLPWLLPRVPRAGGGKLPNRLPLISRWKIFDNLRRSLLMPALLALLVAGWTLLPGSPWAWSLIATLVLAVPWITSVSNQMDRLVTGILRGDSTRFRHRTDLARWFLSLAFLPFEALLSLDAIFSTIFRLTVTHRGLLQWTTSAESVRQLGKQTKRQITWRQMATSILFSTLIGIIIFLLNPSALFIALPFILLWLVSPHIAHVISKPIKPKISQLSKGEENKLRSLARRTWLYFEEFVGPEDQWLPPDHFQEDPLGLVAHRTSPTNIGLMLLSTLAAYDLGYLGLNSLTLRLNSAFDTMARMERHRDHLLNWYDTRDLQPLPPRYVSTVDSGNLAASLLVLKQACLDLPGTPVLRWERWQGLLDALSFLEETMGNLKLVGFSSAEHPIKRITEEIRTLVIQVRDAPEKWAHMWSLLAQRHWEDLNRSLTSFVDEEGENLEASTLADLRTCTDLVHVHLFQVQREIDILMPWLLMLEYPPVFIRSDELEETVQKSWGALQEAFPTSPRLEEIPGICSEGHKRLMDFHTFLEDQGASQDYVKLALQWADSFELALNNAKQLAEDILNTLENLASKAEREFQAMDFRFLYDGSRKVFHIGYHVDTGRLDPNYYDLLASEARISSLIAMAKREVPQSHWLYLARPLTQVNGTRAILSWSGTMFEYLMPSLIVQDYDGTLIQQSNEAAIDRQIAYGRQKGVPWGISESGYYAFDANMFYQYRAFGTPGLGLKRGLADDLVITPYASIISLPFRSKPTLQNIQRLTDMGMVGRYGFYEAADFTPSRLPLGDEHAIVRSYMAHHQGMILLALANRLQDDRMVRRFHADPRIKGVELLLQERVPQDAPIEETHRAEVSAARPVKSLTTFSPWTVPVHDPVPQVHFLSNGRYSVLLTSSGGGLSRWMDHDLTRWRADTTLENWGTWIYIQDRENGNLWSTGYMPTGIEPELQNVLYEAHKAEFWRTDGDISSRMEVTVAPDEDVEIRRVELTNNGDRPRTLMLTSYAEVTLAEQEADRRHPAFNKLFIESEYIPHLNTLLFRRRPRSVHETPMYMVHLLVGELGLEPSGHFETDRAKFIGRGRTTRQPAALDRHIEELPGTAGSTLDPIIALGQEVLLPPGASKQMAWITLAASSRESALALAERYRSWPTVQRAFERSRSHTEMELRQLDYTTSELENIDRLLGHLLYPHHTFRAAPARLAVNRKGQSGLWPYTISGDYPIMLVRISIEEEAPLVLELLRAHAYWRKRGLKIDLVIVNERETGYSQDLSNHIFRLISRTDSEGWLNRRGGIFLLRADQMNDEDRILLETAARVLLYGDSGTLSEQLSYQPDQPIRLPYLVTTMHETEEPVSTQPIERPGDLQFDNGIGGFSQDGREYLIHLQPGQCTPAPWTNVIANEEFGFLVSEAGPGTTWAENSGENRLTPWSNDPVSDTPGEVLYIRDEETGSIWTPTPHPAGAGAPYLIRHGTGYSIFQHHSHDLQQELRLFAAPDSPVKIIQLKLENSSDRVRRITATYYAEWILGTDHDQTQPYVILEYDNRTQAILARNPYNTEFAERVAFLAASKPVHGLTGDRAEFLGRMGTYAHPAALDLVGLSATINAGLDPCAAIMIHIDLGPGQSQEIHFVLGQGKDLQTSLDLVERYEKPDQVNSAWDMVQRKWDGLLDTVQVKTPEPAMDLLLNHWLLYQSLACRVWGRSAFYQSSGAFGFRDQLQDVMALVHTAPHLAREHILEAAEHQFEEGDVLHWWHPPSGRGVRTRITDDLLWLPYVTAHYITATGDMNILTEEVPFRRTDPLDPEEEERYGLFSLTEEVFSLYEHCLRALEKGSTNGAHGLPLIGTGDWNDGMNRVGVEGRGESVWLGWFLYSTLMNFAPVCDQMNDSEHGDALRKQAEQLQAAIEKEAWDGRWYRRAYYDDGSPLGSAENREAQIDSIAQSWAVLSGAADPQRTQLAMDSLLENLVRYDDRLMLLFTPPFDKTTHDPGYIKGYLPGIRENGGQYTHGVQWAVWALAELGRGEEAEELFRLLNPIYHGQDPHRYIVEPYVVAADIYSMPPHTGRGGWTWYTGSAAWMYRLGLEGILGLKRRRGSIEIDPRIPPSWPGFEIYYNYGRTLYRIQVDNANGVSQGLQQIFLDDEPISGRTIPLTDDGNEHNVRVVMGMPEDVPIGAD